jgi:hypothetical protein
VKQLNFMDKDRLKLIVRNLELLVDSLKSEVYSDTQSYMNYDYESIKAALTDYDEVFEDDDGYPD